MSKRSFYFIIVVHVEINGYWKKNPPFILLSYDFLVIASPVEGLILLVWSNYSSIQFHITLKFCLQTVCSPPSSARAECLRTSASVYSCRHKFQIRLGAWHTRNPIMRCRTSVILNFMTKHSYENLNLIMIE